MLIETPVLPKISTEFSIFFHTLSDGLCLSFFFINSYWFLVMFQNKTCVQTLEGHAQNISCVGFHPELPIILTGSEDGM